MVTHSKYESNITKLQTFSVELSALPWKQTESMNLIRFEDIHSTHYELHCTQKLDLLLIVQCQKYAIQILADYNLKYIQYHCCSETSTNWLKMCLCRVVSMKNASFQSVLPCFPLSFEI